MSCARCARAVGHAEDCAVWTDGPQPRVPPSRVRYSFTGHAPLSDDDEPRCVRVGDRCTLHGSTLGVGSTSSGQRIYMCAVTNQWLI